MRMKCGRGKGEKKGVSEMENGVGRRENKGRVTAFVLYSGGSV